MNSSGVDSENADTYAQFESYIREALISLTLRPLQIFTRVKHSDLPGFTHPVEEFEVEADFPGARCLISFGKSALDADLFFWGVELRRTGQPTLFLENYLANRKDPRERLLRFRVSEITLEHGIQRIVEMLTPLLNEELRPVLEGNIWLVEPFNWGQYK